MTCCGAIRPRATRTCASTKSSRCSAARLRRSRTCARPLQSSRIVSAAGANANRPELTVLALSRVAQWEANTPLELIVDTNARRCIAYYIDDGDTQLPGDELPPYDVLLQRDRRIGAAQPVLALARRVCANAPAGAPINPTRSRRATRPRRGRAALRRFADDRRAGRRARRCGGAARARASTHRSSCGRSARKPVIALARSTAAPSCTPTSTSTRTRRTS